MLQDNKPAIFEVEIKSAKNKEIKVNLEESSVKKIHGSHPYNVSTFTLRFHIYIKKLENMFN